MLLPRTCSSPLLLERSSSILSEHAPMVLLFSSSSPASSSCLLLLSQLRDNFAKRTMFGTSLVGGTVARGHVTRDPT